MMNKEFQAAPFFKNGAHRAMFQRWFLVIVMAGTCPAIAEVMPPDLTTGEQPIDAKGKQDDPLKSAINLGPTGLNGWIYHKGIDSSMSRQILVTSVSEGSPAAGILQVNDVILGVDGTGADPVPFSSDARISFGKAIGEAEARDPALLKLLIWRAGKQSVAGIKLQTMGAYSPTAPYQCAKSAIILEQGLKETMANQDEGVWSLNSLPLLAANDPANPANAARQAKAREWARKLILPQDEIDKRLAGYVSTQSKVGWTRGHELVVLAEYYLHTRDPDVLPSIEAMAVEACNGQSLLGTMGHQFSNPILNGKVNGPYNIGYGAINSAGVPCFYGLLLARKCGVTRPELEPAIRRATNFFGSFTGYGAIPYGEHMPGRGSHESNGKMGLAALALSVEGTRKESARYFTKMATASASEREVGHCGSFFNYMWAPLGANVGGPRAAASHFSRISWRLDLNRRWDGGFDYDCWYHYTTGGPTYAGRPFWASIPLLLTYAMPLQQLTMTGKDQDTSLHLWGDEIGEAAYVDDYDATKRITEYLILDLGFWSPKVQQAAAKELAARADERETLIPQLIAIAEDPDAGERRVGACFALGEMKDGRAAGTLAALLTDDDEKVRWAATYAMRFMPRDEQMAHLETMLKAAVTTGRPFQPLEDRVPMQFAHGELTYLLFYNGTAYGPSGVIAGDRLKDVDRELLYPAIESAAKTPMGHPRGSLSATFEFLTKEDVKALSGTLVDTAMEPAPADNMFKSGVRTDALATLQTHRIAEGVVLAKMLANDPNLRGREQALDKLAAYAKSSAQVLPPEEILKFCEFMKRRHPAFADKAQAVLDAIATDQEPVKLIPLKHIESVTAKDPKLKLPAKSTDLMVEGGNLAKGDTVYTWRKLHGAGKVTFANNGTPEAKATTVQFDGKPGKYLFEVTMSDSRGLTEVKGVVGVILHDSKGRLPGNRAPLAAASTVDVAHATTTPIVLQGKDPEGYELSYALANGPSRGRLKGQPPHLTYTPNYGYSGVDRFTFRVTDSEGQSAEAVVQLRIASAETLQVAVYEPFDYPAGPLDGKSGSTEVGLAGEWKANEKNAMITEGSISYGNLLTKGGKYQPVGGNNWGGTRTIKPSALKANGLLNDGATLWFSAAVGYGPKADYGWSRLAFALGNNGFHEGNGSTWILDDGDQPGVGVGFVIANHGMRGIGGRVLATRFQDEGSKQSKNDLKPDIYGSWDDQPTLIPHKEPGLVVGRFIWGKDAATPDRIEIFGPLTDLELPANPVSVLEITVDQSSFDTLSFDKSGEVLLDEIRFGPSYESVLAGTQPLAADSTAPVPK